MALRTIGLVPARGGSKGIPRKNVRPLLGRPLLEYTASAALASRALARVVLSTDDAEIAEAGRRCGLEVPFMRPADLAQDDTPSLDVVRHAVSWLEAHGERLDAVCLLQPTHPFRRVRDIDDCIALLESASADSVATVVAVPPEYNPHWVFLQRADGSLRISTGDAEPVTRRQDLPPAFRREGSVYVTRREVLMEHRSMYGRRMLGHPVPIDGRVNLDTPEDWARAEALLAAGRTAGGDTQR